MTGKETAERDERTCQKIRSIFQANQTLLPFDDSIEIRIENAQVVLEGELPSPSLIGQLVPAIRQAGVLSAVNNLVRVAA